jgi:predicted nicotinamide N-methyase
VLELGAGTGLVGIIAAKMGAKVMATDGSDMVVKKLSGNFELNDVSVESGVLWWGEENEILNKKWDFIVGADITYDEDVCASLAETYAFGIKRGATGILAATVRNEKTLMAFVKECGMIF